MKKSTKKLLAITGGTVATAAIIFANVVANHNKPYFDQDDLNIARNEKRAAETEWNWTHTQIVENAPRNKEISEEILRMEDEIQYENGDTEKLTACIDTLEALRARIITRELNKSEKLKQLGTRIDSLDKVVKKLQRDSATVAQIERIPAHIRFVNNLKQMTK